MDVGRADYITTIVNDFRNSMNRLVGLEWPDVRYIHASRGDGHGGIEVKFNTDACVRLYRKYHRR